MRKILSLIMAFAMIVNTSNAAFTETKAAGKEQQNTLSAADKKAAAEFFVTLSRKDYEELTGRHLSVAERLAFKIAQKQAKNQLKREATSEGFNIGGLLLGFFLGLIGVLLAYVFSKDSNLRKWSWIGFGAYLVILIIIVAAAG